MRAWFRRLQIVVSSAVVAPVLLKLAGAAVFLTVLGLVGRGVFDPLGVAPASASAAAPPIGGALLGSPNPVAPDRADEASPSPSVAEAAAVPRASASASAPAADAGPPNAMPSCGHAPDGTPRIVLNLAAEADLVRLPGVGAKKAKAILALRDKLGKFRRLEDLARTRGIKRRFIERIRPFVVVDERECNAPTEGQKP